MSNRPAILAFFQAELQALCEKAGLSYREMEARYREKVEERRESHPHLKPIAASTFCKAVTNADLPSWETVKGFAIVCKDKINETLWSDVAEWHRLYRMLQSGWRDLSPKPDDTTARRYSRTISLKPALLEPCDRGGKGRHERFLLDVLPSGQVAGRVHREGIGRFGMGFKPGPPVVRHGPTYPSPDRVTTIEGFGRQMRRLLYLARLSQREVARRATQCAHPVSAAALSTVLNPTAARLPRLETLDAYLVGLGSPQTERIGWLVLLGQLRQHRTDPETVSSESAVAQAAAELGISSSTLPSFLGAMFQAADQRPGWLKELESSTPPLPPRPPRWARRAKAISLHDQQHVGPRSRAGLNRLPKKRGNRQRGRSRRH